MSLSRFVQYLCEEGQGKRLSFAKEEGEFLYFHIESPLSPAGEGPFYSILTVHSEFQSRKRKPFSLPEIHAHYLLLYNLSMISRYETEWWSELLHSYPSKAYTFILEFLSVSAEKRAVAAS